MIDTTTNKPLRVSNNSFPGLMVPLSQLAEARKLLDEHGLSYWVDDSALSLDGRPPVAFVTFASSTDVTKVQAILDCVP